MGRDPITNPPLATQDANKEDLGAGGWTEGAIRGVEEAAARMQVPFRRSDGWLALTMVDVVADTAALLNRDRAWPEAWQRQGAPVREDLEAVGPMLDSDLDDDVRGLEEAQQLREYASQALAPL